MMQNYLCWDPAAVRQVINPFAEHAPDSLFRAVHSDWDLTVSPPVGKSFQDIADSAWTAQEPNDFLKDFLRHDRPHALAAVLGETGSGKSHLVHWMRLNIKQDEQRLVLVVRKSGTSLRAIVEMIIQKLPKEDQERFCDKLKAAGDGNQSRDDQKQQLLNDLAQAIREETVPQDADEIEQALVKHLPDLFQDPYMRSTHYLDDETIIAEIVDHIFAPSNASDRPDRRRLFEENDLPHGGMDYVNASQNARSAMDLLYLEPSYPALAIEIINRNLDRAIARTLSFSSDSIIELMSDLRAHLKRQGKELVLLVEEFARLQGVDRALLQAITTQGDESHCKMRSAIAVTTGFFESVAATAYMRTTHIVDMNRSAGRAEGQGVTTESLSQFASRYLNAVRLGRDKIERWNETATPGSSPPSRCTTCAKRDACHAIFGAVDDYGLYPFTKRALWISAERVDGDSMPNSMNPRVLQNDLLVEVLDNFGSDIKAGAFPPFELVKKLGGVRVLSPTAQTDLRGRSPQMSERLAAFLELYDGSGEIKNLDARLRQAFNVPEIPGASEVSTADSDETIDEVPERHQPETASAEDQQIAKWVGGGDMDEKLATRLRALIFPAISDGIDWDWLGLAKTSFAGQSGRPFQRMSISFDRQTTQVRQDLKIKIKIPGDLVEQDTAGAALQGLIRASKQDFAWDFPDGDKMLAAFLYCMEIWTKSIEQQLRKICEPTPEWTQATAALELLCVGAAIGGRIAPKAPLADMINGAFSNWPSDCASTSKEMQTLYGKLFDWREKLCGIAHAQLSSPKGGRAGSMLNPAKTVRALRDIRKAKWHLLLEPPDDDKGDLEKLYREIKSALPQATAAEMSVRRQWLADMKAAFGADATRANIVTRLQEALLAASDAGVSSNNQSRLLADALEGFGRVQFDDSLAAARSLGDQEDAVAALAHFGRGRRRAVDAGLDLKEKAAAFLDAIDRTLSSGEEGQGDKQSAIEASLARIDESLVSIDTTLREFDLPDGEAPHAA